MRKVMRHDTVNWTPPAGAGYVPMENASKALFGEKVKGGAKAARQRMLERKGLAGDGTACAEDARQRMIERNRQR